MSCNKTDIDNINHLLVIYNNSKFYKTSPFMLEYYNKRMKMWHPYADIIGNEKNTASSLDVLIKAIDYVENQ